MKNALVIAVLLLAALFPLWGQENTALMNYYNSEVVNSGYDIFGGLNLSYRGNVYSVAFGLDSRLKSTLSKDLEAKAYVQSYSNLNLSGNLLTWGGLGAILASGLIFSSQMMNATYVMDFSFFDTYILAYVGGMAAITVGAFLMPASYAELLKGVNTYNRNRMAAFK